MLQIVKYIVFVIILFISLSCDNIIDSSSNAILKDGILGKWEKRTVTIRNDTAIVNVYSYMFSDSFCTQNMDAYFYYNDELFNKAIGYFTPQKYTLSNDTIFLFIPEIFNLDAFDVIENYMIIKNLDFDTIILQKKNYPAVAYTKVEN